MPGLSRVYGPYGTNHRLVVYEDGRRTTMTFKSAPEAAAAKARLLSLFANRSQLRIETVLETYLDEKERDGAIGATVSTLRYKLRQFLPLDEPLHAITPPRAEALYLEETRRTGRFGRVVRAATHRALLRSVKAFYRWAIERGHAHTNPFAGVRPIGKVSAGKVQLRLDEARKLNTLLLQHAEAGDEGALAVLVQIIMGLRSSEVLRLQVRDVDNQGRELWIDGTKTRNARRPLAVESEPLQRLLALRCAGRQRAELLFGEGRDRPHHSDYLWHRVRKYCALADVPVVCPHSLRGLHSSLAMTRGASSRFVADALGHGSDEITKRHYIDPTAAKNASIKRVSEALSQHPAPNQSAAPADLDTLAATLRGLAPEQLQTLLKAVAVRR